MQEGGQPEAARRKEKKKKKKKKKRDEQLSHCYQSVFGVKLLRRCCCWVPYTATLFWRFFKSCISCPKGSVYFLVELGFILAILFQQHQRSLTYNSRGATKPLFFLNALSTVRSTGRTKSLRGYALKHLQGLFEILCEPDRNMVRRHGFGRLLKGTFQHVFVAP